MLNNSLLNNSTNLTNSNNSIFLNEKIDLTRFVLPHGVLFVLQESDLKILQVSQNTHYFIQKNHE